MKGGSVKGECGEGCVKRGVYTRGRGGVHQVTPSPRPEVHTPLNEAGGTHPTGMHSFLFFCGDNCAPCRSS